MAGFDAFISYSRRASVTLASDLQTAVERFAKPFYRMRAVRVFRDDASMSANTALWSTIERGLTEAEWFVLLASPAAAQSQYVANEVTWWREHKSADRIVIVLEEGADIVWDRAANDFDLSVTDSIPPALSGAFAEEPRWIDLRWYESAGSHGKEDPRWPERVADVAATIRGAERDQLIGENVRQHKRAQLLLRGGIAALSLLLVASLVATIIAIGQRSEAQRQRNEAQDQRDEAERQARIALARQLAAQAVSLAPTDLQTASLLAVQAFRTNDDAQTRAALFQLATASPQLVRTLPVASHVHSSAVTPDGHVWTGDADGRVLRWEGATATEVTRLDGPVTALAVSADGRVVIATDGEQVTVAQEGQETNLEGFSSSSVTGIGVDGSGRLVAVSDGTEATRLWSISPQALAPIGTAEVGGSELGFGAAGLTVYGPNVHVWGLVDTDTAAVIARGTHDGFMGDSTAVSADGATMASFVNSVDIAVWQGAAAFGNGPPNGVAHTSIGSSVAMAASADGSLIASQADGRVEVAAVQSPRAAARDPISLEGSGVFDGANAGALSFGGSRYLVSATQDKALLWDLDQSNRFGSVVQAPIPTGCEGCGPGRIAVSADGSQALLWALGDFETGPVVVRVPSGEAARLDPGQMFGFEALAWDGNDRIVGYQSADGALVALPSTGGPPSPLADLSAEVGDERVMDLVVAGDSIFVMTESGLVLVVDRASGSVTRSEALVRDGRANQGFFFRVAPDGRTAYVASYDLDANDYVVLVADLAADRLVFDGSGIGAAYDDDSRLHVFDGETVGTLDDGELRDVIPAPGVVSTPAPILAPDATIVVTGGTAGTNLSLLDLTRQGARFGRLSVPQQENVFPVSTFTPDGRTLVTALPEMESLDLPPTLRTLSLVPDDWIAAACAVGARDLTEEDWARYGVGPAPDDLRCVQ